ncbi:hypothetical protein LTR53_000714 [Teratosphaeriaceae sp. CCFEE 6253]|nr:hypothetical protein LTR53_000714 [Teratosphaeriaceae sp. CCFEE 6253]
MQAEEQSRNTGTVVHNGSATTPATTFEYFPTAVTGPHVSGHDVPTISAAEAWWDASPQPTHGQDAAMVAAGAQPRGETSRWPLKTEQEVMLMRCYKEHLTRRFDHVDSTGCFSNQIPELAAGSPVLLNTILAAAARHLQMLGELEEAVTLRYQAAAIDMLLPPFQQGLCDATDLTAAVLLRHTLMRVATPDGAYMLNALPGLGVYLAVWQNNPQSALHAALSIAMLRMSIFSCWVAGTIPAVEADCSWITGCYYPGTTDFWNCKITMLLARTINYCHDEQDKTEERWVVLDALAHDWAARKPKCFQPIFEQEPTGSECFPKLEFAGNLHAMAFIYHSLTALLLASNRPSLANLGDGNATARYEMEQHSLYILRRVCGVALSHPGTCLCLATLALSHSGHLLHDMSSQKAAHDILIQVQRHAVADAGRAVDNRLRATWAWCPS